MAKIIYEVKKNQNSHSAAFGKWYAQIKNLETLNTRKLANHISEHGSIYTPDVVYGVLEKFRSCLVEMLLESKKVKIEGLGTFYCTLENQKNGALKKEDFNVNKHLKALHIRFLPEQAAEENISSREFLKQAEFINVDSLLKSEETGGGSEGGDSQSGGSDNSGAQTGDNTQGGSDTGGGNNQGGGGSTIPGEGRPVTTPRAALTPAEATTRVAVARPFPAKATKQSEGALPQQGSLHSYQPLKTT